MELPPRVLSRRLIGMLMAIHRRAYESGNCGNEKRESGETLPIDQQVVSGIDRIKAQCEGTKLAEHLKPTRNPTCALLYNMAGALLFFSHLDDAVC